MADELKFPGGKARDRDSLDDSLVSLIRDAYSPPQGDEYWAGLESRIMNRVAAGSVAADARWWNVLAPWARPALIAAVALFALAGAIDRELTQSDEQVAYDSVLQSVTPDVLATSEELISVERGADGATLSYFLSH